MSILLVGGIAVGAFSVFNTCEYVIRRCALNNDVMRGISPANALDQYQKSIDALYESLWPIKIMISPGIDLATKHFKKAYQID